MIIDPYNEISVLPKMFFAHGLVGYILYFPIEFVATLFLFSFLWLIGSFVINLVSIINNRNKFQMIDEAYQWTESRK